MRRLINVWNNIDGVSGGLAGEDHFDPSGKSKISVIEVDASKFYKSNEVLDAHSFDNNHMQDFIRQLRANKTSNDLKKP